jgi:4-amino-4-deoxy-L-arabinose transferase-like glycosyltransferase
MPRGQSRFPMVCLFHGDYGPADPAFNLGSASTWVVDANSLKDARNLGEAEAIQRHLLRGEPVSWCDQGYAWVDQDAVGWLYLAAFLFVILPYLIMRARARAKRVRWPDISVEKLTGRPRLPR